ncbi:MAG: tetratricopeptide repeat protein [Bacteroidales bacterium]
MKKILYLLLFAFLFSCSVPGKYVNQSKYDQALEVMIVEVKKHPENQKEALELATVYQKAKERDTAMITEFVSSGRPDIWYNVHQLYEKMNRRQEMIMELPDTTRLLMNFKAVDYKPMIEASRLKACGYLYASAKKQLESGTKSEIGYAYESLNKINVLMPGFRDVKALLADFTVLETLNVLYRITIDYPGYLPYELEEELGYLNLSELDVPGYRFFNNKKSGIEFDYSVEVRVLDVKILPEDTKEVYYTETAKVQDGVGYKLDEDGNFAYDSLGKKIEYPLLKTIACYVTETSQRKSMLIGGMVTVKNLETGATVATEYLTGETKFFHRSARFKGDLNALSPETFKLVGSKKMEYPTDLEMILRASDKFKVRAISFMINSLKESGSDVTKKE